MSSLEVTIGLFLHTDDGTVKVFVDDFPVYVKHTTLLIVSRNIRPKSRSEVK